MKMHVSFWPTILLGFTCIYVCVPALAVSLPSENDKAREGNNIIQWSSIPTNHCVGEKHNNQRKVVTPIIIGKWVKKSLPEAHLYPSSGPYIFYCFSPLKTIDRHSFLVKFQLCSGGGGGGGGGGASNPKIYFTSSYRLPYYVDPCMFTLLLHIARTSMEDQYTSIHALWRFAADVPATHRGDAFSCRVYCC